MRVTQALFAKSADLMKDDTIAMIGGCFDSLRVPVFPFPISLAVIVRIRLDQSECGVEHTFLLGRIASPEGSPEMPPFPNVPFNISLEPGGTYATFTCIMVHNLLLTAPGTHIFSFIVDGVELAGNLELEVLPPL